MSDGQWMHELMSGRRRGPLAAMLRGVLAVAEVPYSAAMRLRNALYDRGAFRSHPAGMPVISVGNLTAGGTGKTPVVQFLYRRLVAAGYQPGILMRGYRARPGEMSDEQKLLADSLGAIVVAEADRVAGAARMAREHPEVNLILLDDGMQHRRLRRQFELVLIDATRPLGFGHVHPRGLLREPLAGLRRADAFIITRSDLATEEELREIEVVLRGHKASAPAYRARHAIVGLRRTTTPSGAGPDVSISHMHRKRVLLAAGIANPQALERQLAALQLDVCAREFFADHHHFSECDVRKLIASARELSADAIVVTEKDWVKLAGLWKDDASPPLLRLALEVQMGEAAASGLIELIQAKLEARAAW